MGLFVSTVSGNVGIPELGITIVHPATDFNIGAQFSHADVRNASSLTSSINGGLLTWRKTAGGSIETAAGYDPNFLTAENLSSGPGAYFDRVPTWRDTLAPEGTAIATGTKTLLFSSRPVQVFTGAATGQIVKLPDPTTIQDGHKFEVFNESTSKIVFQDFAGTQLLELNTNYRLVARYLLGTWRLALVNSRYAYYNDVSGLGLITTTARAFTMIPSMTITPPRGLYRVNAFILLSCNASLDASVCLFVGGTQLLATDQDMNIATAIGTPLYSVYNMSRTIEVDGTQAIDMRWFSNSNTLRGYNRFLSVVQVG